MVLREPGGCRGDAADSVTRRGPVQRSWTSACWPAQCPGRWPARLCLGCTYRYICVYTFCICTYIHTYILT